MDVLKAIIKKGNYIHLIGTNKVIDGIVYTVVDLDVINITGVGLDEYDVYVILKPSFSLLLDDFQV